MGHIIILLLGIIIGALIPSWLFARKIEKQLNNKQWLFTAELLHEDMRTGWQTGVMTIHNTEKVTPKEIENNIVERANALGKKADRAIVVMFTRWA